MTHWKYDDIILSQKQRSVKIMEIKNLSKTDKINRILKMNLKKLKEAKGITQEQLGDILDVHGKTTISYYLNLDHDSVPPAASLYRLKEYYGIPLDVLYSPSFDPSNSFEISGTSISEYDKFLGVYSLYYLTTSKISTVYNQYSEESALAYGVMAIVKDSTENTVRDSYSVYACFSFKEEAPANELKAAVEEAFKSGDYVAVRNLFAQRNRFCEGDFEIIQKAGHYAISMTGYSMISKKEDETNTDKKPTEYQRITNDKILIMGFNPDNTETPSYIGGAALSSSLSRGSEKTPCSQVIMISRPTIEGEGQEIRQELIELRQKIVECEATDSIMDRYHELNKNKCYTERDKDILLRHHIDFQFSQELEKSRFQLFYLLKEKDKIIYNFLKQYS